MRGILIIVTALLLAGGTYLYWLWPDDHGEASPVDNHSFDTTIPESIAPEDPESSLSLQDQSMLREEAQRYVAEIIEHDDDPVKVDNADDFVSRNEPISLFADKEYDIYTLEELKANVEMDAPITVVREQEQLELTTFKELLVDSGGNLYAPIKILEGGDVKETTIAAILENHPSPDNHVSVIRKIENLEVTTLRELINNETLADNEPLKVIREPYRLQTTTVSELLMGEKKASDNSIFYVRNITDDDVQGLWGIVHNGLVRNFASGIAIRRGDKIHNYQVDIPINADERLADQSSSFLGKMIDRKTQESYVYNYKQGIMGKNPDLIHPGQEIVIVGFTPEELYRIYEHFVARSESRS